MFLYILFWGSILTFIFVLGSFLVLVFKFGESTQWNYIFRLNFPYLILAIFLLFLYHTFDVLRLKTIAEGFKIKYPISYAYKMSFIMTFASTVTPAHLGGELAVFYLIGRLGFRKTRIFGTVLFKTLSGMSFFVISTPILVFYAISKPFILKKIMVLLLIFIFFSIISIPFIKWLKKMEPSERQRKLKKRIKFYCLSLIYFWRYKKKEFIMASIYSILLYLTFLNFAPLLLYGFNVKVNLLDIYMLELPLIFAIFSSPSPGGSGVGELGGIAIFEQLIPVSLIGLFVILWRLISQYLSAFIGGILLSQLLYEDIKKTKGKNLI